jgi:threonine aldolase
MTIDLRSDTVTKPTRAMREVMMNAEVGDDIYREDPEARALEEEVAAHLGKEAALFVPSGTMANQIAMQLHLRPGDEVLVGEHAHIVLYESGALSGLAGAQARALGGGGMFDAEDVRVSISRDYHEPRTRLVAIENTHNRGGGSVWPKERIGRVAHAAKAHGLALHLDGARLWNASVASGESEAHLAAPFDTVSVCFSKGLGAPIGSAICGTRDAIQEALRIRKRLGGGMRQVGMLAAACRYAITHHRARLKDDHDNARTLASLLRTSGFVVSEVQTNIVLCTPPHGAPKDIAHQAKDAGVLISPFGPTQLRAVTHLDVDAAMVRRAAEVIAQSCR